MTIRERGRTGRIVLGVDPGSNRCGYGLISVRGREACYIDSGTICPPQSQPLHKRLCSIYDALLEIVQRHRPHEMVVEKIFFAKGAKSALSLGHARGIILLAAASQSIDLYEYSALEVKKAVVGYGRAEKRQVEEMVKMILRLQGGLSPDSADALALALCHLNTIQFKESLTAR